MRTRSPKTTAQEQLLITTAADRAATALARQLPSGLRVWLNTKGVSGAQSGYAIDAVKDALLRRGLRLAADKDKAKAILLLRAGALSTREHQTILGIPPLPVPLAPGMLLPQLALYQHNVKKGVVKLAGTLYDRKSGQLVVSTSPAWGFSRASTGTLVFVISWHASNLGVDLGANPPKVNAVHH